VKEDFTTETQVMRKNPFLLRETSARTGGLIGNSSVWPFVLSLVEGRTAIFSHDRRDY
jgi:hypothetical protein